MMKKGTKYKGYLVLAFSIGLLAGCGSDTKESNEAELPNVKSERKVTVDGKEMTERVLDNGMVVQTIDEEVSEKDED